MSFRYLQLEQHATPEIETLLTSNVIGTPGLSMLYQHLGVTQKLYSIAKPYFVSVYRHESLVGTCCFCERNFSNVSGFYVRYFAFKESFRLKGAPKNKQLSKNSGLREEIKDLLQGEGLTEQSQPFFHYAYVDPRNPRSANLCQEFGFVPIRKYTTRLFTRFFPRGNAGFTIRSVPSSSQQIRELLSDFYADHNHFHHENLNKNYYYVEDDSGEIIAGVQVNPDLWRIVTLPGANGRLLLQFFHYTPLLSRLLSKQFRFLATEGIYYKAGYENVFDKLLETLLYKYNHNTAIVVVDTGSKLYDLTQKMKLGFLSKTSPEVQGDIIAYYNNVEGKYIADQKEKPSYISVHDLS